MSSLITLLRSIVFFFVVTLSSLHAETPKEIAEQAHLANINALLIFTSQEGLTELFWKLLWCQSRCLFLQKCLFSVGIFAMSNGCSDYNGYAKPYGASCLACTLICWFPDASSNVLSLDISRSPWIQPRLPFS